MMNNLIKIETLRTKLYVRKPRLSLDLYEIEMQDRFLTCLIDLIDRLETCSTI